ncbi:hypothetical protein GUJ93_ZPchr0008g13133 [Zizania palustris]|uniref:Uncharacterized protein n=1 Tax=Zizania palustris TaxID=103762 RepID=A0A8J5R633_ZIZPA|nr:hypothetical protein GUJ93_ZPchr0008g13133 [Zizania palustris]KAG8045719.1 hypothetical protein GUJ93_ZPchr0008g13133 [Zizania palustris]KAG8045720.1 hypothetical protein GUJ93_ZPchr0008g13133 [Zizania palustris]
MNTAELAAKAAALEEELSAKSSRIAVLEARVSLLEAENARLRRATEVKGEPAARAGKKGPNIRRLEEVLGGSKHGTVEMVGGQLVAHDVIEVSDGEEEGMNVIPTLRRSAVRVETDESEGEDEIEDAEGGGGGGDRGSVNCGNNVGLEDYDVSITPRGRKRAAGLVITSDSEDEVQSWGGHGNSNDDGDDKGVAQSRKRALRGISDSENEDGAEGVCHASRVFATGIEIDDDTIPICEVVKKMRRRRLSEDGGELGETKGCSTPATRRSARLAKSHSKRVQSARRVLNFVESKDCEESEHDSEEDDDMDEFINDEGCSENSANSAEPEDSDASAPGEGSFPEPEESDNEIKNYKDAMACIGRKRKAKEWKYEAEMLSAFAEHPELCLKAVCALYRRQTVDEQDQKATIVHNKQGFNHIDASRGSHIAEFLLDGDAFGPLKKTVHDLEEYDRNALEFCHKLAARYSKQLFSIYQNKEDPYFIP